MLDLLELERVSIVASVKTCIPSPPNVNPGPPNAMPATMLKSQKEAKFRHWLGLP